MSSGKPSDWENTQNQLKNPNPVSNNETWLGHRLVRKDGTPYQAANIDLMVLEGRYSVDEVARKNNITVKRVNDHLEHLQDGDSRNKNTNMKPHKLKIVIDSNGTVMFATECHGNNINSINSCGSEYLPSKKDFEAAYRALTRLGESISIDAVLAKIEKRAKAGGHLLKSDWKMITENNIKIWSMKG